jgi:hypothetical protein
MDPFYRKGPGGGMDPSIISPGEGLLWACAVLPSRFLQLEDSMSSLKPESPEKLCKRL